MALLGFLKRQLVATQSDYWITRNLFLRFFGFILLVAYLVAYFQAPALIGSQGILPAPDYIQAVLKEYGSAWEAFIKLPSLFWFAYSDALLQGLLAGGVVLSALVMFGRANILSLFYLWFVYMSLIQIGQRFYSYGWESQVLEMAFYSIWLLPLFNFTTNSSDLMPSRFVILLHRWTLFRLMLGAGLIKIRGDACWLDLTCMNYHYETQPNPNPLSLYLHALPGWFHSFEVLWNHFIELIVPFFIWMPRRIRHIGGVLLLSFQAILICTGNLAFLNWLTLCLTLVCFEDSFFRWLLPAKIIKWLEPKGVRTFRLSKVRKATLFLLGLAVLFWSWNPILNLLSQQQFMNTSFNPLRLVNAYGAFGSIGKTRYEVVISGTNAEKVDGKERWQEYKFKCKPGDPQKRPCIITPYHYRLDWQIWFSAMRPQLSERWLMNFATHLLRGTPEVVALLKHNPFPDQPPRYLKMDLYQYEFVQPGDPGWWKRTFVKPYMAPAHLKR